MKKTTLLFAATLMAFSCSDDDDNNAPVALDGTWKLTYVNLYTEPTDLNGDGIASENFMDETSCMNSATIVFRPNNTATFGLTCISDSTEPETVTYNTNGNTVEFIYAVQDVEPGFDKKTKYTRAGNTLTATFIGNSSDYVPGEGEYGDSSHYSGATFTYTKQ